MKILMILPLLFLLIGCQNKQDYSNSISISKSFSTSYSIEPFSFNFDNIDDFEFRTVYDNNIYLNEIIYEDIYCYTNHLYKYNLTNHEIKKITGIDKATEDNRIYDIFEIEKDQYLYVEITPNKIDGDFGLIYYAIYLQNGAEKELIDDGYAESVFKVPVFQVIDNKVYINSTSIKLDEKNKLPSTDFEVKIIEYNNNEFNIIYNQKFPKLTLSKLMINGNDQMKILLNSGGIYKEINLEEKSESMIYEDSENEFYERIIPINDGYFFSTTDWNDENYTSQFISTNQNVELDCEEYRFVDHVQFDNITLAITNDGELYGLKLKDNILSIKRIDEIPYAIYFRKIDQYSTLIYSSENKVFKFTIDE